MSKNNLKLLWLHMAIQRTNAKDRGPIPVFPNSYSANDIAKKFDLNLKFIERLIKDRYFFVCKDKIVLNEHCKLLLEFCKKNKQYQNLIIDLGPSHFYDLENGDLRISLLVNFLFDYFWYHNFIDKFCWIIKLHYSDRKTVKSRKYRLDVLLQEFIKKNHYDVEKLKKLNYSKSDEKTASFHLKKGWYNELVRNNATKEGYLNAGTNVKGTINLSGSFAWNIIQSYYSCYEFINALVFTDQSNVDTSQHTKTLHIFGNSLLPTFKKRTLFYPFNLNSAKNTKVKHPPHVYFQYASYPRNSNHNIYDLEKSILEDLEQLSKKNKVKKTKTFIDFLYETRVWANYTGIESMIHLENGYYLDYLNRNLALITFFTGAIAELALIPVIGAEEMRNLLFDFNNTYISKHSEYNNKLLNPIFIRFRIYQHLGIIPADVDLKFMIPESIDPVKFI